MTEEAQSNSFIFVVCQVGAEQALKNEVAVAWPEFRLAFSRPGLVTFKLPEKHQLADDFDLRSTFARTYGFSLGKVTGENAEAMADSVWELAGERGLAFQHIHAWQRDAGVPGERGFEPGATPLADEVGRLIAARQPSENKLPINRTARAGDLVLDCILVDPHEWWLGHHRAAPQPSRWPGGVPILELPEDVVSRAYFKMCESLLWSKLPVQTGDLCVEIGSSPGGSCQALLDRDLAVVGIDPADMNESVLSDPNFTHVKARGADLKRREFRDVRWLFTDSNVAPKHTLDTVEHIVTNEQVNVRGMLLTLKLLEWKLADAIPEYIERIRSWGYEYVRVRQLAFNRQEVCVAALRSRALRRGRPKKKRRKKSNPAPQE